MLTKAFFISPNAGVVDHDRIADPMGGVINLAWGIGIDQLDHIPVRDDLVLLVVCLDRSTERTMD